MSNLYGEFKGDKIESTQPIQPPQEIKIVEVKGGNSDIPFRWQVAAQVAHAIISNHEYSTAISKALSDKGPTDRKSFQNEVANVSIGFADVIIEKLQSTTKIEP